MLVEKKAMKLSIIIPVYNERKFFLTLLNKVRKVNIGNITKEIIIVDDYSTDGTRDLLKKIKGCTVLYHDKNKGKGAAVRTGLRHATGDITLIQDADLEYDPNDYPKLLRPILEGRAKVVYGSRFKQQHHHPRYWMYYFGNISLTLATNVLYGTRITDMWTCYKVFTREVRERLTLKSNRFNFDPEITAKILRMGYRIHEVPVWYRCRAFGEGKKISWRDGVKALYALVRYRFFG